jgi:hypothetical protein
MAGKDESSSAFQYGIDFLGIFFIKIFRVVSLRDLWGGSPLKCSRMMVLLLYLVDFCLSTGTNLLMYNVFFEVFYPDDLLVQRSHPLLKGLGDLTLQGSSWENIGH